MPSFRSIRTRLRRASEGVAALATIVSVTACSTDPDDPGPTEPVQVMAGEALVVAPATSAQIVGATLMFTVADTTTAGRVVKSAPQWSTSDSTVLTITGVGQGTVKGIGSAAVRVKRGPFSGQATLQASAPPPPPPAPSPTPPPPSSPPPPPPPPASATECATPRAEWIFCDDFETNRLSSYFEVDSAGGSFSRRSAVGFGGSVGMRVRFAAGQTNAGSLKLAFGRTPGTYFRKVDGTTTKYRDIYTRVYVRYEPAWTGGGADKLMRSAMIVSTGWAQGAVASTGSRSGTQSDYLRVDPYSGVGADGVLRSTKYNDWNNLRWLGEISSPTPILATSGVWICVESRIRLNDANSSNGLVELHLNGQKVAQRTGINFIGSYSDYGINTVFLENFWNAGSPKAQERYLDRLVVSTAPIGC